MSVLRNIMKRLLDIVLATTGLLLLAPFFVFIVYFLRKDSAGPIFFKCFRMGKDNKPFIMWKFRTMYERPSSYNGPRVTQKEDERITPFGHWLRDTKINELPQLWNVLKGDMSLVGPRPEDVELVKEWDTEARSIILTVSPGITSPASILYRDEEKMLSKTDLMDDYFINILPDKIRLDQLYVRYQSFWSDLDILFWTVVIILPQMLKAKIPEGYLFSGPISRLVNRYVSWFLIDLIISFLVVGGLGLIWRSQGPLDWGFGNLTIFSLFLAFCFSSINSISGLNRIVWSSATVNNALSLMLSCWVVTLLLLIFNLILPFIPGIQVSQLPIGMLLSIGLLAQFGFLIARYRWRMVTAIASRWLTWRNKDSNIGEKVLIVGTGEGFYSANWLLRQSEYQYAFSIVGVVDDNIPTKQGMLIEGCKVLGKIADIPNIVEKEGIGLIVFTSSKVPAYIKKYTLKLWKKNQVKLIQLDNLSRIINEQLSSPVQSVDHGLWSQNYPMIQPLYDSVTGLPNRFLFQDRLMQSSALAKRYLKEPIAMFIHLDSITQTFGPVDKKIRNAILKQVSERLFQLKRESDTLAYVDKNEFAFILENVQDENAIKLIADRLLSAIRKPFEVDEKSIILHATISISKLENEKFHIRGKESEEVLDYLIDRKVVAVS